MVVLPDEWHKDVEARLAKVPKKQQYLLKNMQHGDFNSCQQTFNSLSESFENTTSFTVAASLRPAIDILTAFDRAITNISQGCSVLGNNPIALAWGGLQALLIVRTICVTNVQLALY
jgi:hypothetical protein